MLKTNTNKEIKTVAINPYWFMVFFFYWNCSKHANKIIAGMCIWQFTLILDQLYEPQNMIKIPIYSYMHIYAIWPLFSFEN